MTTTASRGSVVLALALAGHLLFYEAGLGLNVTLWTVGLALGWGLTRSRGVRVTSMELTLIGLGLFFAVGFAWRTAVLLRLASIIGLIGIATLMPLASDEAARRVVTLRGAQFLEALVRLFGRVCAGFGPDLISGPRGEGALRPSVLRSAGRGVVLAAPLTLVFGSLLMSADAGFDRFVRELFSFDIEVLLEHGLGIAVCGWLAAGLLARPSSGPVLSFKIGQGTLGAIEAGIVLGTIDLLFLTFVVLQSHYFFGGDSLVRNGSGYTYSEYARRGFFELVAVSALVLPLLLAFRSRLHPDNPSASLWYKRTAGTMVGLTLVIVASAFHRMALYQRGYGLTEQRFYASAFIGGIAFTLLWFAATILRNRPARFMSGALAAWTAWALMLQISNPARSIALANIQRATISGDFDRAYAIALGADAVPALVAMRSNLNGVDRSVLEADLRAIWADSASDDWRSWSVAEWRAREAVRQLPPP